MKSTIKLVQAIGVEFIRRAIRPLIVIGSTAIVLLLILGGYLTTISAWWSILEVLLVVWALLFISLAVAIRVLVGIADPPQSTAQRQLVRRYVDKLQRVAEHLQTSQFLILFRVVRDTAWPPTDRETFIETVSHDTKTLNPDFKKLQEEFQTKRDTERDTSK
jgi:hypothetical protein